MKKVSIEEVSKRLNEEDKVMFVDARSPEAWEKADLKLPGAVRIPPDEAEKHLADVSRDDYIVTYCT